MTLARDKAYRPIYKCRRCNLTFEGTWLSQGQYFLLMMGSNLKPIFTIHDCEVDHQLNDYPMGVSDLIGLNKALLIDDQRIITDAQAVVLTIIDDEDSIATIGGIVWGELKKLGLIMPNPAPDLGQTGYPFDVLTDKGRAALAAHDKDRASHE